MEKFYAVYQHGHAIFGVGKTEPEAKTMALEYLDTDKDGKILNLDNLPSNGTMYGELYISECTSRIHDEVLECGGDIAYDFTDDVMDLIIDPNEQTRKITENLVGKQIYWLTLFGEIFTGIIKGLVDDGKFDKLLVDRITCGPSICHVPISDFEFKASDIDTIYGLETNDSQLWFLVKRDGKKNFFATKQGLKGYAKTNGYKLRKNF